MRQRDTRGVILPTLASRRPLLRRHDALTTVNAIGDGDLLRWAAAPTAQPPHAARVVRGRGGRSGSGAACTDASIGIGDSGWEGLGIMPPGHGGR
jgi:hypothetical protein